MFSTPARLAATVLAGLMLLTLSGCGAAGYYWQSVSGHLQMMNAARPVQALLSDAGTPEKLKAQLALAQRIRLFAVSELGLPDNASYSRYADLHRSAVVWNVVAAPALSLTLKTWCFPVAGCVAYRGYFAEQQAHAQAVRLQSEGLDVDVYGVPAYSTLGWMNWAGGDPLLNTFVNYPEGELARVIFHELAHQVVYAGDDTVFNESFASTVERLGAERWLTAHGSDAAQKDFARRETYRRQYRALTQATRQQLEQIYTPDPGSPIDPATQLAQKNAVIQNFKRAYAELRRAWGDPAWRDNSASRRVDQANNAFFGAQAAYDELVPGFEALFEDQGRNWLAFYDAVRKLAKRPVDERHQILSPHPSPRTRS
jgi:predicted aminopeptidase